MSQSVNARRRARRRKIWTWITLAVLAPLALSIVVAAATLMHLSRDLPSVESLSFERPSQTTVITSSDGLVLANLFEENRKVISIAEVPRDLRLATMAAEDHAFFEHRGVYWRGIARALWVDVRGRRYAQGASTITQQLVRNVYLNPDKSLKRKFREAILAVRVERRFSKAEILQMYLNQVFYGSRAFGVQAASRTYFGKSASSLSLTEAATLAGLVQRPSVYDPYENPSAARKRRNVVLKRMADLGYISTTEARKAMDAPLGLAYQERPRLTARRAPYFVDYVIKELEERFGPEAAYHDGLQVQTTLNVRAQEAAEQAVRTGMARSFGSRPTQAALVAVDPVTGYIRAMVGGRDYRKSVFNRAAQAKRQPGSTFKPFVYAAALNSGLSPKDYITDEPLHYKYLDNWKPRNYDYRYRGRITLTEALAQSVNIPAVKLIDMVGPESVVALARAAGIRSPLGAHLSLALGTSEVSPLELAGAYGIFANQGVHVEPFAILSVRDSRGHLLYSHVPEETVVLDGPVSERMDQMLRAVVQTGTGKPAGVIPGARGKTGTTDSRQDAWFVGYTPELVAAVWVGNDMPSRIPGITGSGTCAPIWVRFMRQALTIFPPRPTGPPAGKSGVLVAEHPVASVEPETTGSAAAPVDITRTICVETGQKASRHCPQTEMRRFRPGTEPNELCYLHALPEEFELPDETSDHGSDGTSREGGDIVVLCAQSGSLAGPRCPTTVTRRVYNLEDIPVECPLHPVPHPALPGNP